RVIALLDQQPQTSDVSNIDIYMVMVGEPAQQQGLIIAEQLRDAIQGLRLQIHCGGGSAKSQFKKANRSGARYALVLGENELAQKTIGFKPLREEGIQQNIPLGELAITLQKIL
ncbi:histidinol dehydrogenase, partial [Achromatium sp. WMS1]